MAAAANDPGERGGSRAEESVRVIMVSEANEPGSESGKRSDDRRGVPDGTPQPDGCSLLPPEAVPGSFASLVMATWIAS